MPPEQTQSETDDETEPDSDLDESETTTITNDIELTIKDDPIKPITADITVHEVVGDSKYDRALVATDSDSDDNAQVAFGYHNDELPDPL